MPGTIDQALSYFKPGVITFDPGATEEQIRRAEEQVGHAFPPSMQAFLLARNGGTLIDWGLNGVEKADDYKDVVKETITWRELAHNDQLIAIAHDGSGDAYVLLTDKVDIRGEHPVAKIDNETGKQMFIVASCYERFVWFYLYNMTKQYRRDGEDNDREVYGPWPYPEHLRWMISQDPEMAQWRPLAETSGERGGGGLLDKVARWLGRG